MHLNLAPYAPHKIYSRNGTACFLCFSRKKLIAKSPEEIVRQSFINFLNKKLKVPMHLIEVEVSLSRTKKGIRDRADILVYAENNSTKKPVLVIECKKKGVLLTDKHLEQIKRYNITYSSRNLILTNGNDVQFYSRFKKEKFYEIQKIPTYEDLIDNSKLSQYIIEIESWRRHSYSEIFKKSCIKKYKKWGDIGEDTSDLHAPFFINLIGLLLDDTQRPHLPDFHKINLITDCGIRKASYGNAAGGSWPSEYRAFVIKDFTGNDQVISFTIISNIKVKNHRRWGTTTGSTMLNVAIDNFEKSHNSLQLRLDNYVENEGMVYKVFHSGSLTGGKGSYKHSQVLKYIKQKAPDLVSQNNKILLGQLDNSSLLKWSNPNVVSFIENLVRYSLLRDEIRKIKKK